MKPEDYYAEVALATLPRDRWGALGLVPKASEGSVWSAPVTIPGAGCEVRVNAEGVAGLSVEVADERFNLLPAFSGDNRGTVKGPDGLSCPVQWPNRSLAEIGGQTVRLRIHFRRSGPVESRLFAVYLQAAPGSATNRTPPQARAAPHRRADDIDGNSASRSSAVRFGRHG